MTTVVRVYDQDRQVDRVLATVTDGEATVIMEGSSEDAAAALSSYLDLNAVVYDQATKYAFTKDEVLTLVGSNFKVKQL